MKLTISKNRSEYVALLTCGLHTDLFFLGLGLRKLHILRNNGLELKKKVQLSSTLLCTAFFGKLYTRPVKGYCNVVFLFAYYTLYTRVAI